MGRMWNLSHVTRYADKANGGKKTFYCFHGVNRVMDRECNFQEGFCTKRRKEGGKDSEGVGPLFD